MRKIISKEVSRVKDAKVQLKKSVFGTKKTMGLLDQAKDWKGGMGWMDGRGQ